MFSIHHKKLILPGLMFLLISLFKPVQVSGQNLARPFSGYMFHISEVMLHDVISPPAAARYYAYSALAAWNVMASTNPNLRDNDFQKFFKDVPAQINLDAPEPFHQDLCAVYALLEAGRHLLPSGYLLEEKQEQLADSYRKINRVKKSDLEKNLEFARQVAKKVVDYASTDGYNKLSTYTRYSPSNEEGKWYPTPPAYIAAVEPNWNTIRPFLLDSADQFIPPPPAPYDLQEGSPFHRQLMAVYEAVKRQDPEEFKIAKFWDCNPFEVSFTGHMAIGLKKITPGGHWMGIAGIACEQAGLPLEETIRTHALLAVTLHDAFISCWDEKYRSDRIRPETVINQHLDPEWKPVLQTPPFPEYTSGHSVVSAASATILTRLFGESFAFNDTTELYFGLPARQFDSFRQAAEEAAISRLYGGIHYPDACENGVIQGRKIGEYIVEKVKLQMKVSKHNQP